MLYTESGSPPRWAVYRAARLKARVQGVLSRAGIEHAPFTAAENYVWTLTHSEAMANMNLHADVIASGGEYKLGETEVLVTAPRSFTAFRWVDVVPELIALLAVMMLVNVAVFLGRW